MIGLVIVSHSIKIAEGARELADQMTQGTIPIAIAAGVDDPDHPIGTDPIRVMEAIQSVYSDDGVIVLMDLGSAILSAETAIELLDPAWRDNIYLSPAPLIEGAIAAALQASTGLPVKHVIAEADIALISKQTHLSKPGTLAGDVFLPKEPVLSDNARELLLIVPNKQGLHARPAARIVRIASRYQANLVIRKNNSLASANSISQIAILGAREGDKLTFMADGEDAEALLNEIRALADNNFGDPLVDASRRGLESQAQANHPPQVITGIPASKGVALGEVYAIDAVMPDVSPRRVTDVEAEKIRLQQAIEAAIHDLKQLTQTSKYRLGANEASIFDVQVLLLQDPELHLIVGERIVHEKLNAESVWWTAIEQIATRYYQLENLYLRERAVDVLDVGRRVLRYLSSEVIAITQPNRPCIIVAAELSPSDIAQFDEAIVMGIVTEKGGATSHSAILARALGVPAVVGVGHLLRTLQAGQFIAIDGEKGWVWTDLIEDERDALEKARQQWVVKKDRMKQASHEQVVTPDGKHIEIAANISKPDDARKAASMGAEGVGLFRTEYLFIDADAAPSEDEQFEAYLEAAEYFKNYPLVIRTLDIGGDKPVKYIPFASEANPFLGYRGIRYWLDTPELATTQLRAIYRASAYYDIQVMLPMVSTLSELIWAKQLIDEVQADLDAAAIPYNLRTPLGIMIEVPSAVLIADQLARQVDFFSIGTNDLTQYLMAADRGNARVNYLVDYYQPSVLRAIQQVIDAAHQANIWVSICGEMAGDALAVPLLIGMGMDKLSMNAPSIPEVKAVIRALSVADMQRIANEVFQLESPNAIRNYLQRVLK